MRNDERGDERELAGDALLIRALGTWGLAAGIVNVTVGAGIFRLPSTVAGSLGAAAPFILAWIVVREHELSWPRGELTAIAGITAGVLILVLGFIARPGDPRDTISLQFGWILALVASIVIIVGAIMRTTETETVRKPPGVL